jgi:hypothetical protein
LTSSPEAEIFLDPLRPFVRRLRDESDHPSDGLRPSLRLVSCSANRQCAPRQSRNPWVGSEAANLHWRIFPSPLQPRYLSPRFTVWSREASWSNFLDSCAVCTIDRDISNAPRWVCLRVPRQTWLLRVGLGGQIISSRRSLLVRKVIGALGEQRMEPEFLIAISHAVVFSSLEYPTHPGQ